MTQRAITMAEPVELPEEVIAYLQRQARKKLYGKVIVSFQAGKVCQVTLEEVKKLGELGVDGGR